MGLRSLVAAGALGLAVLPGAAQAREWLFDVTADGIGIGTYRFVLQESGATRHLTADARFRVKLVLIEAYSYEHHADETWQEDCLTRLATRTVEHGRTTAVAAREEGDAFVIEGPRGRETVPRCPMTFAYWNPRILQAKQLINSQTGAPTPVTITAMGSERIDVRGANVDARRYRIETARNLIDVWYSAGDEWLGLRTTTKEGGHVLSWRLK
jgi:hypothetical protein